jgi:carbonic anhydrase
LEEKEGTVSVIDDLVDANRHFADALGHVEKPALPPKRKVAIVTCMDARIVPARIFGLEEGDAHVIRNAGGRTREALRSLVISQRLLGTEAVMVVQHTDCGMLTFTNEDLHAKVSEDLGADASDIDFLPFGDLDENVRADIDFLKRSPLIPDDIEIRGFVYDVGTRRVREVT